MHPPPPLLPKWIDWLHLITPKIRSTPCCSASPFRVISLTCGGGNHAVADVLSLAALLDPDVIFLQEMWDCDVRSAFALQSYHGFAALMEEGEES